MLDLKKAFDTVDSEILIEKLQWFRIKNMQLSWFENYLTLTFYNIRLCSALMGGQAHM